MNTRVNRRDRLRRAGLVLGGATATCGSTPDLDPAMRTLVHSVRPWLHGLILAALGGLGVFWAEAAVGAEPAGPREIAAAFARLEARLEQLRQRGKVPGMAAGIASSNQVLWAQDYGWDRANSSLIVRVPDRQLTFVLLGNSEALSRKFDLGRDEDVTRSPFAREFLKAIGL